MQFIDAVSFQCAFVIGFNFLGNSVKIKLASNLFDPHKHFNWIIVKFNGSNIEQIGFDVAASYFG